MAGDTLNPEALEFLRRFASSRQWKFAKTYAKTFPHEYVVREWEKTPEGQADFARFVYLIEQCGMPRKFYSKTFIYLEFDGFKYWTDEGYAPGSLVLNREDQRKATHGQG